MALLQKGVSLGACPVQACCQGPSVGFFQSYGFSGTLDTSQERKGWQGREEPTLPVSLGPQKSFHLPGPLLLSPNTVGWDRVGGT